MIRTLTVSERGCGLPKEGGCYLLSEPGEEGVLPLFVILDPVVPVRSPHHRGYVEVSGELILERKPEEEWLAGASGDRRDKDSFAYRWFGMPLIKRKKLGVCRGNRDEAACMDSLMNRVRYSSNVTKLVRDMTKARVPYLIPESFASLVKNVQTYQKTKEIKYLVLAAAAVHRMPREARAKRNKVKPFVHQLLSALSLFEDALDLAKGN